MGIESSAVHRKVYVCRILSFAKVRTPHKTAFFRHQGKFLHKVVKDYWKDMQADMVKKIRDSGEGLVISGDARCDSMGHRLEN